MILDNCIDWPEPRLCLVHWPLLPHSQPPPVTAKHHRGLKFFGNELPFKIFFWPARPLNSTTQGVLFDLIVPIKYFSLCTRVLQFAIDTFGKHQLCFPCNWWWISGGQVPNFRWRQLIWMLTYLNLTFESNIRSFYKEKTVTAAFLK